MTLGYGFDWAQGSAASRIDILRRLTPQDLRAIAHFCPWTAESERVMGWIMAQRGIDLATAITVFLNAEPERFNDLAKREVPAPHRPTARVLDNICLRINSGFYLADTAAPASQDVPERRLRRWIETQEGDRASRRRGRWILDDRVVAGLLSVSQAPHRPEPESETAHRSGEGGPMAKLVEEGPVRAFLRLLKVRQTKSRGRATRARP